MKKTLFILFGLIILCCVGYFVWNYTQKAPPKVIIADSATIRQTNSGDVIGYREDNNTHSWLGIPYAKPPVDELRWKAPLPPESREEVLEALKVCSVCSQFGGPLGNVSEEDFNKPIGSEDCLYLNIWAPAFLPEDVAAMKEAVPVMVWIHGGGNSVGHAGDYSGKVLAEKYNVIVVMPNYRLGPFGWFSHPSIRKHGSSPEDRSGNYGTLDIIQALKWVKNNIPYFGGDPNNITIFGESAGAFNTLSMMLSPKAKGLFHRAISQSGGIRLTAPEKAENYKTASPQEGHPYSSREIINKLLLADNLVESVEDTVIYQEEMTDDEIYKYLQEKSNLDILSVYPPGPGGMIPFPALFQDGEVFPKKPALELFNNVYNYNSVPLIIGTNRDELKLFMAQDPEFVNRYFKIFLRIKDIDFYELYSRYTSDHWKAFGADEIASRINDSQGENVYCYRFDWDEEPSVLGTNLGILFGAAHGLEIPFVFNFFGDTKLLNVCFTDENLPGRMVLSDSMSSYWAEFAYTGSPGKGRSGKNPEWKSWDNNEPEGEKFIIFDTEEGGGIRMSSDIIRFEGLKARLLADTTFPSQEKHCMTYVRLFQDTPLWNDQEYENLGEQGCRDYPKERFSL